MGRGGGPEEQNPHSVPALELPPLLPRLSQALPQGRSHTCLIPDPCAVFLAPGDWSPPLLIPDACIVNELPSAPPSAVARPGTVPMVVSAGDMQAAVALVSRLRTPLLSH